MKSLNMPNKSRWFKLKRIIDGDTFTALVDVNEKIKLEETIRLSDFDAPETWRPKTKSEKAHGLKAKKCITFFLKQAKYTFLETVKYDGKYGRRIANIYIDCSISCDSVFHEYTSIKPWVGFKNIVSIMRDLNLQKLPNYND